MAPDEEGRDRGFMHVYRSEDGGISWGDAIDLRYSWDHPQLAVDHTVGRFGGRAYIGVLYGYPVYRVGIFRSDDDGRTWIGPAEAANGGGEIGINVANLLVLSDGTLFVPYVDFEFLPERRSEEPEGTFWFVISDDGGITFSAPEAIATQKGRTEGRYSGFPQFAVDNRSDAFRDRVYAAWTDFRFGNPRILVVYSSDRGKTWSEPTPLTPEVPPGSYQFQPAIAVNDSGVVGITWFDTRGQANADTYHEYFTASLDGGQSWLEPVQVSTQPSYRYAPGNVVFTPSAWRTSPDSMRISFLSPASRWGNGGDYMGLAADARGVFFPLWTDSRSGSFQMMTAEVAVIGGEGIEEGTRSREEPFPSETEERDLTSTVDIVFDPVQYDGETQTARLFIRLRNAGDRVVRERLVMVVQAFGSGLGEELREFAPALLNASNGQRGVGAMFDFTAALGSDRSLEPNEVTGPVEIQVQVQDPLKVPNMHVQIRGRVGG
jgi:hypothetical protein